MKEFRCLRQRTSSYALALMAALVFVPAPTGAVTLDWTTPETVLSSGADMIGMTLDLQSSFDGDFHLLMSVDPNEAIWYGKYSGGVWSPVENVVTDDFSDYIYFSLGLFGSFPIGVYFDESVDALHWTMRTASWSSPSAIPDTSGAEYMRLKVEPNGAMHVAWTRDDGTDHDLLYSQTIGSTWYVEVVSDLPHWPIEAMDLLLDSTGTPHVAWFDINDQTIKYAVQTAPYTWNIDDACDVTDVSWLEMGWIDPDIPYIGYLDHLATTHAQIRDVFKFGGSFVEGLVSDEPTGVDRIDLAFPDYEPITTSDIVYVFGNSSNYYYCHNEPGGWERDVIPELSSFDRYAHMSAEWDPDIQRVGLAIQDRAGQGVSFLIGNPSATGTPTPTRTPTRTPTTGPGTPTYTPTPPTELGVTLELPTFVHIGEDFYVNGYLNNPASPLSDVPTFFILEVYGDFWFWPSWAYYSPPASEAIDYELRDVPTGSTMVPVIATFTWPDTGPGTVSNLRFYGAMLNNAMDAIRGTYDMVEWGYGP